MSEARDAVQSTINARRRQIGQMLGQLLAAMPSAEVDADKAIIDAYLEKLNEAEGKLTNKNAVGIAAELVGTREDGHAGTKAFNELPHHRRPRSASRKAQKVALKGQNANAEVGSPGGE